MRAMPKSTGVDTTSAVRRPRQASALWDGPAPLPLPPPDREATAPPAVNLQSGHCSPPPDFLP
jgi:hypothetical protein